MGGLSSLFGGLALGGVLVLYEQYLIAGPILVGGLVGGVVMLGIAGLGIPWMPTDMVTNRRLADEYNQRLLRGEVGPAPPEPTSRSFPPSTTTFAISGSF